MLVPDPEGSRPAGEDASVSGEMGNVAARIVALTAVTDRVVPVCSSCQTSVAPSSYEGWGRWASGFILRN